MFDMLESLFWYVWIWIYLILLMHLFDVLFYVKCDYVQGHEYAFMKWEGDKLVLRKINKFYVLLGYFIRLVGTQMSCYEIIGWRKIVSCPKWGSMNLSKSPIK